LEKRRGVRVQVSGTVLYRKHIYPRLTIASFLDLSMEGTRIESLYPLNVHEKIELSIAMGEKAMKCRGRVRYVLREEEDGKVRAGVEFEPLSESDRVYLRQYLSYVEEAQVAEI